MTVREPATVRRLPRPYYEQGGITIYNGDCRDILSTLEAGSVDLVLMDPPFYLPARISTSRRSWPRSLSEVAIMEGYFREAFRDILRALARTGAFYTFSDSTSYAVFFSLLYPAVDRTQCIAWDKEKGGLGNGWRHSSELILHGAFSETAYATGFRRDVLRCHVVSSAAREHASEKPVALLSQVINAHPIGLVLDPYMGSGATLIASKTMGRRAIGIELEERYCEIAARRLQQAVLPLEVALEEVREGI